MASTPQRPGTRPNQPTQQSQDLEQRVTALEGRVATLESNFKNLSVRVYNLEVATGTPPDQGTGEPPDTEPPGTEPPPGGGGQEGTENIQDGKNLQQLVDAGGQVRLPAGSYLGHCVVNQPTQVIGAPTSLSAQGLTIANRKGMFEGNAAVELTDLNISDVVVPDQNGASCKPNPNISLTMTRCDVTRCQMGVLTAGGASVVELVDCNFHDNGGGDGYSHEVYIGNNSEFRMTNCTATCGTESTHAVKSRAKKTTIKGCTLRGSTNPSGAVAGSPVNLPEGGDVLIEDTTIVSIQGTPTEVLIGYTMENANAGVGSLTMRNVQVTDGRGNGGVIQTQRGGTLVLENCRYTTANPPRLQGWSHVTGEFVKAA